MTLEELAKKTMGDKENSKNQFLIITEETLNNADNVYDLFPESVNTLITGNVCDLEMDLEYAVTDCESPIEQMFAIEFSRLYETINIPRLVKVLALRKQVEIKCNSQKYRVDFCIPVVYWDGKKIEYIIECDGHEFHQKTKRQVEKDNERTRALQLSGYIVMHFSGSEIFHGAANCAEQVKNMIQKPVKTLLEAAVPNSVIPWR